MHNSQPLYLRTSFFRTELRLPALVLPSFKFHRRILLSNSPHHDYFGAVPFFMLLVGMMPRYPSQAAHGSFIQEKLIMAINTSSFASLIPDLAESSWDELLKGQAESQRLSVMGYSLLHSILSMELRSRFPKGTPHFYTVCF